MMLGLVLVLELEHQQALEQELEHQPVLEQELEQELNFI